MAAVSRSRWLGSGAVFFLALVGCGQMKLGSEIVLTRDGGTTWSNRSPCPGGEIAGIWGLGDVLYAVGRDAKERPIVVRSGDGGERWRPEPDDGHAFGYTGVTLRAVHGASAEDVWAVGDRGVILHKAGTSARWRQVDVLGVDLRGVWARPGRVVVVGEGLIATSSDGRTFTRQQINADLWGIAGNGETTVAVGWELRPQPKMSLRGVLAVTRGDQAFTLAYVPGQLHAVAADGAGFLAVGPVGAVYASADAATWESRTVPDRPTLFAVQVRTPGRVAAVSLESGLWTSDDDGRTWAETARVTGLPADLWPLGDRTLLVVGGKPLRAPTPLH